MTWWHNMLQVLKLSILLLASKVKSEDSLPPLVKDGELLLRLQPSARHCYLQYGSTVDGLATFNPSISNTATKTAPVCVCEQWWQDDKHSQLILYAGTATNDHWESKESTNCLSAIENIVSCESFDEDKSCSVQLWLGETSHKTDPSYMENAVLKCTKDSGIDATQMPKSPILVYEISVFDIGKRCNRIAIMEMLNYRLELYRSSSQFFWQIPIFDYDDLVAFCDPRLPLDWGASIKIYFKCVAADDLPELDTTKHQNPVSRGSISSVVSPTSADFKCYYQAGQPWSNLLMQNLRQIPAKDAPVCVCEENAVLKVDTEGKCTVTQRTECDKSGDDDCEIGFDINTNKVSVFCNKVTDSKSLAENLGTTYFPNYVPIVKEVFLYHHAWKDLIDVLLKSKNNWGIEQQMEACPYNENVRPKPQPELIAGKWIINQQDLELWLKEAGAAFGRINIAYKNWISERTQYKRYNSDIHLQVNFNVSKFVDTFCPSLREESVRKKLYDDLYEKLYFFVGLKKNLDKTLMVGSKKEATRFGGQKTSHCQALEYLVKDGELLLRVQPSVRHCYLQYGQAVDGLDIFNPSLFNSASETSPVCVCEKWWQDEKHSQLIVYTGTATNDHWESKESTHCLSAIENIVGCESSDDDQSCSAHLWLGEKSHKTDQSYMDNAVMKCTKDSSTTSSEMPKSPVFVYEISDFDIGERCDKNAIKEILNYRLELYRKNSQFFWQIPVFDYHDLVAFCDPRLSQKHGASMKIYFKCMATNDLLELDSTKHQKPVSRGSISSVVSPPADFKCYHQAGQPWSNLLMQNLRQIPSKDDPACVCEENAVLKVEAEDKCEAILRKECDKSGEDHCGIGFDTYKVSVFCNKVTDSKSLAENPRQKIMERCDRYALLLKSRNDWGFEQQMEACPHEDVGPRPEKEIILGVLKINPQKLKIWNKKRRAAYD